MSSLISLLCFSLCVQSTSRSLLFFFNDTATTEIYTLSLHDALPISAAAKPDQHLRHQRVSGQGQTGHRRRLVPRGRQSRRSEEHTSELQSPDHLVCRLLLEKKKKPQPPHKHHTYTHRPF